MYDREAEKNQALRKIKISVLRGLFQREVNWVILKDKNPRWEGSKDKKSFNRAMYQINKD